MNLSRSLITLTLFYIVKKFYTVAISLTCLYRDYIINLAYTVPIP